MGWGNAERGCGHKETYDAPPKVTAIFTCLEQELNNINNNNNNNEMRKGDLETGRDVDGKRRDVHGKGSTVRIPDN